MSTAEVDRIISSLGVTPASHTATEGRRCGNEERMAREVTRLKKELEEQNKKAYRQAATATEVSALTQRNAALEMELAKKEAQVELLTTKLGLAGGCSWETGGPIAAYGRRRKSSGRFFSRPRKVTLSEWQGLTSLLGSKALRVAARGEEADAAAADMSFDLDRLMRGVMEAWLQQRSATSAQIATMAAASENLSLVKQGSAFEQELAHPAARALREASAKRRRPSGGNAAVGEQPRNARALELVR